LGDYQFQPVADFKSLRHDVTDSKVMLQRLFHLAKAPFQCGLITSAGDVMCQTLVEGKTLREVDKRRNLSFACFGFFYGKPTTSAAPTHHHRHCM
jgi:hypothetical protein